MQQIGQYVLSMTMEKKLNLYGNIYGDAGDRSLCVSATREAASSFVK